MASNVPDDLALVSRLACFGSEDGTFHVLNKEYSSDQTSSIKSILSMNRGPEVIKRLKTIANQKCYVKKKSLLFSLANIIHDFGQQKDNHKNDKVCQEAYGLVQEICDSPLDLFTFVHFDKQVGTTAKVSWGRGMRDLISKWYLTKPPLVLAQQVTQCKSGHGFSHKDLIKQTHIKCDGNPHKGTDLVLNYLLKGKSVLEKESRADHDEEMRKVVSVLENVEKLKSTQLSDKEDIRGLIETNGLVEKQIPTHLFKIREVFEGLMGHMSLESLVRHIPKMAELGLLDPMSTEADNIVERLQDPEAYKQENVSPVSVFVAMRKYDINRLKKWIRNPNISQALHSAYDSALESGIRTGKRFLLAVHVDSKLVKTCVTGSASTLTPIMPCAILAQMLAKLEESVQFVYFNTSSTVELPLTKTMGTVAIVEQMVRQTKEAGNENYMVCDPLRWATLTKKPFDCVLIVCGKKQFTSQADLKGVIKNYRTECGVPEAKVAMVGLSDPTPFPDRDDLNYLDVTGFDEDVLSLLQRFFQGLPPPTPPTH